MNPLMALASSDSYGSSGVANYSDDVFYVNTRAGTGATATITGGPDIAGKGGLHITKARTTTTGWRWTDTVRGATNSLDSSSTATNTVYSTGLTAFTSSGATIGADSAFNASGQNFVDYFFCQAPKFFDVVTWIGDGTTGKVINHDLGIQPGMIIVHKTTNTANVWPVWHRSLASTECIFLETTAAKVTDAKFNNFVPTSTSFQVDGTIPVNTSGDSYVAYVFGHDTSSGGNIQCGTFTTNGSGNATITLGWEPQFLMAKASGTTSDWFILDVARNWDVAGAVDSRTQANTTAAESTAANFGEPTATGFNFKGANSQAYIYMAVRRSNKPPTSGTQIYNAVTRTGTGTDTTITGIGFAPDVVLTNLRQAANTYFYFNDRLRGIAEQTRVDAASSSGAVTNHVTAFGMDGISAGVDSTLLVLNADRSVLSQQQITYFFRRAAKAIDVVCDTGTGSAHTVAHNLGAVPQLMFRRARNAATGWIGYCSEIANTEYLEVSGSAVKATATDVWNSTTPTASVFTVGTNNVVNTNTTNYITYLFGTVAGVSKVGSYTGNGTSQTINCGFSGGARFVMVKRVDGTAGDWMISDTVRGIVAGADSYKALNGVASENTLSDWLDPNASGFIVNQEGGANANVSGSKYIYLAFA